MNTPAHLIFSAAAFAHPGAPRVDCAALMGALAPDLSLYLLTGVSIIILGVSAETVFRTYYYLPEWQQNFSVGNSFVL